MPRARPETTDQPAAASSVRHVARHCGPFTEALRAPTMPTTASAAIAAAEQDSTGGASSIAASAGG